jgi:hypothetical protein
MLAMKHVGLALLALVTLAAPAAAARRFVSRFI